MLTIPTVYACEECPTDHEIGLQETIDRSELIIVGYRSDSSTEEYPQTIEITAKQILKGELTENPITVESFTSDCEYGIIIFDETDYIIFLRDDGDVYAPVNQACAVTKLPYESVNIDEFMVTYLPDEREIQLAPTPDLIQGEWAQAGINWPLGFEVFILLIGAAFLIKKNAKH